MIPKFLVVGNDSASVEAIIEVLERKGYGPFAASGGCEALETLAAENIDIVITDKDMPDLSVTNLYKQIKDSYPYTQVIILTGYSSIDSAVDLKKLEVNGCLSQPMRIKSIQEAAENAYTQWSHCLQDVNLREQLDDKFGFEHLETLSALQNRCENFSA